MGTIGTAHQQSGNFDLKNREIDLTKTVGGARTVARSATDLETLRVAGKAVPASKHGLEAIMGASCDTAAQ